MNKINHSTNREMAILLMLVFLFVALNIQEEDYVRYAIRAGIAGIFFPKVFSLLSKLFLFIGPKVHFIGSFIFLNIIFFLVVFPVGLIKKCFPHSDNAFIDKTFTKEDLERPY